VDIIDRQMEPRTGLPRMTQVSSRESRRRAAYGRGLLVALCVLAAVLKDVSIQGRFLAPVMATALVCGAALLVPRLRWPVAPLLVTVATAWWGSLLLPMLAVVLYDLAVELTGYRDGSLTTLRVEGGQPTRAEIVLQPRAPGDGGY
jgi:hypothetical protein